jgi:hypothetical protein
VSGAQQGAEAGQSCLLSVQLFAQLSLPLPSFTQSEPLSQHDPPQGCAQPLPLLAAVPDALVLLDVALVATADP